MRGPGDDGFGASLTLLLLVFALIVGVVMGSVPFVLLVCAGIVLWVLAVLGWMVE